MPNIGKSMLTQRNSICFPRSTSTSKSLGSVLYKQPAKPPRQSLFSFILIANKYQLNRSRSDWNNTHDRDETGEKMETLNDNLNPVTFIDNSDCSNDDLTGAGDIQKTNYASKNSFGKMSKF